MADAGFRELGLEFDVVSLEEMEDLIRHPLVQKLLRNTPGYLGQDYMQRAHQVVYLNRRDQTVNIINKFRTDRDIEFKGTLTEAILEMEVDMKNRQHESDSQIDDEQRIAFLGALLQEDSGMENRRLY